MNGQLDKLISNNVQNSICKYDVFLTLLRQHVQDLAQCIDLDEKANALFVQEYFYNDLARLEHAHSEFRYDRTQNSANISQQ